MPPEWTPRQRQHQLWLATPKPERTPATKEEWAETLGVTDRTLRRWERLPGFYDAVFQLAGIHLDARLPEVLGRLADLAVEGDLDAIRLALELRGRYTPTQRVKSSVAVFGPGEQAQAQADVDNWEAATFGL